MGQSRPIILDNKSATNFDSFLVDFDDLGKHLRLVERGAHPALCNVRSTLGRMLYGVHRLQPFKRGKLQPFSGGLAHPSMPFTLGAPPPDVAVPCCQSGLNWTGDVPKVMEKPPL